ncbi:hypothetical protein E5288_WYG014915 [Bos mutus]|uniref:Uncharacterized protein n=1 Tax=Bos mutus TaxID=72004 RepID=A0A6B0SAB3_9CETA|nr:hypothetical protein [Bos mutus]
MSPEVKSSAECHFGAHVAPWFCDVSTYSSVGLYLMQSRKARGLYISGSVLSVNEGMWGWAESERQPEGTPDLKLSICTPTDLARFVRFRVKTDAKLPQVQRCNDWFGFLEVLQKSAQLSSG